MVCVTKRGSQRRLKAFVVLLRDTTWKCGVVERLVVNYLRRQFQHCGCTQTSVKDMLEHFRLNGKEQHRFFEAMERLEKRRIIKIVFKPFSSSDEFNVVSGQGGL
ncbi:MAG: hypothetical protein PVH73_08720 [Candidatus Bathyarchaeota archaeon]